MNQISDSARIGKGTTFGAFCVVEENVELGEKCVLGHHVVVRAGSRIGDGVRIADHAVVGALPMRARNSATTSGAVAGPARIGAGCTVGTGVVIYAGTTIEDDVLVADLATVREDVHVGEGTIVGRGAAIENHCRIGRFCKLETNAYVTAHSVLEDYVFLAPGVLTSNDNFAGRSEARFEHFAGVTVRRGGRIGVGAVILPGREIAADTLVAAGAIVTRDTQSAQVVAGHPARYFKEVPEEQLLDRQNWFD